MYCWMDSAEDRNVQDDRRWRHTGRVITGFVLVVVICLCAGAADAQSPAVTDPHPMLREVQSNPTAPQAAASGTANPIPDSLTGSGVETPVRTRINRSGPRETPGGESSTRNPIWTTLGLLCLLLSGLFAVLKLLRRYGPRRLSAPDVPHIQLVERQRLDSHTTVYLLRVGRRLIVAAGSSAGMSALAEIGDPQEVADLCGLEPPVGNEAGSLGSLFSGSRAIRRESAPESATVRNSPAAAEASPPREPRADREAWHA